MCCWSRTNENCDSLISRWVRPYFLLITAGLKLNYYDWNVFFSSFFRTRLTEPAMMQLLFLPTFGQVVKKTTLFLFVFQISFSLYGMLESIFFSLGGHLSQLSAKQAWTNVPREKGNKKTTFWSRLFSPRANYVFLGWAHYSLNCCSFQFINSCHMARNEMLPSMFISVMKILDFFLLHIISFQWQ